MTTEVAQQQQQQNPADRFVALRLANREQRLKFYDDKTVFKKDFRKFITILTTGYGLTLDTKSLKTLFKFMGTEDKYGNYSFEEIAFMFTVANDDGYLEKTTAFGKDVVNAALVSRVMRHYKESDNYKDSVASLMKVKESADEIAEKKDRKDKLEGFRFGMVDKILDIGKQLREGSESSSKKAPVFYPHHYDFMVKYFTEPTTEEKKAAMAMYREEAVNKINAQPITGRLDKMTISKAIDNEQRTLAKRHVYYWFCETNELTKEEMLEVVKHSKSSEHKSDEPLIPKS